MSITTETIVKMNETVVGNTTELMALLKTIYSDARTANITPFFESGAVTSTWNLSEDGNTFTQTLVYRDEDTKSAFDEARRQAGLASLTQSLGWTSVHRTV